MPSGPPARSTRAREAAAEQKVRNKALRPMPVGPVSSTAEAGPEQARGMWSISAESGADLPASGSSGPMTGGAEGCAGEARGRFTLPPNDLGGEMARCCAKK
ncbi:hypothetical protein GCM10017771_92430 [Streptomyces capitiformicae]|uniref:Uncharacterized protein n=1 Tax=Streptomyces capitiformicae TaxID=2014920 RepID=A0A918ZT34_9ACTN|nr:hypothetical protein GCM10017771_92430 [Streptomyces capitiformicae]